MSARDDNGSGWHGGGGSFHNGGGGLGNGGVGGGRGGGGWGGGAGYNGGYQAHYGLNTGNTWHGNTAFGQAGGNVQGYGTRQGYGQITNLRKPDGTPMMPPAPAHPAAAVAAAPAVSVAAVPGLLGGVPVAPTIEEPLPPVVAPPVPSQPLQYTFGPRPIPMGQYAYDNLSIFSSGPPRYDQGYGFGTAHANSIVGNPAFGYGSAGTIGNYASSQVNRPAKGDFGHGSIWR